MDNVVNMLNSISNFIWGPPLLILLMGTGAYLTCRLFCLQVTKLPLAISYIFKKEEGLIKGDVSSFGALCTALAATIGTGNIVGVATAVAVGGPGAIFWMWLAAFFGMATKYAEGLLAIKYREVDGNGQMAGGPMYYIKNGLGLKWLAWLFALFGVLAALLGIGTFTQVNAITSSISLTFDVPLIIPGIVLVAITALVTIGGIKSISKVCEWIVPFMSIFYVAGCLIILGDNIEAIPAAFNEIITSAFTGHAALGGFTGATMMMAMRNGVARGTFSNESGLGSAPIAAATARTNSCVRQGLISMTGTFFDTIIICTMTGLVLVITGVWSDSSLAGVTMTNAAFEMGLPVVGGYIVTIGLIFFAFTSILGWNYYGQKCWEYILGFKTVLVYRIIFIILVGMGVVFTIIGVELKTIWITADIFNGLMAIPNLIGILGLSSVVIYETNKYFKELKEKKA